MQEGFEEPENILRDILRHKTKCWKRDTTRFQFYFFYWSHVTL